MKLVIGNKNYSSWSLRPWLLLHANDIAFSEVQVSLSSENLTSRLSQYSESAKVPVLIDDELTIWDSLAICEYINETYLTGAGWPTDRKNKATARAVCSEMHAGFHAVRTKMPMNCRLRKKLELTADIKADITRISSIWNQYASKDDNGDVRLFGQFSIADCFYAPVALRFQTYGVELSGTAAEYQQSLLQHPSVKHWLASADSETEVLPVNEV